MRNAHSRPGRPGLVCPFVLAGVSCRKLPHVCAFYETHDYLIDLVIPFFRGRAPSGDELCVWVTPDFVSANEERSGASGAIFEHGVEFHRARENLSWRGGSRAIRPVRFWDQVIQRARSLNRSGARASGDFHFGFSVMTGSAFLENAENDLNSMIANKPLAVFARIRFH